MAADVDDGLADPRRPVGQVKVGPAQAERLAAAEAASSDDLGDRAEAIRLDVPEQDNLLQHTREDAFLLCDRHGFVLDRQADGKF